MAFAMQVAAKKVGLEQCPHVSEEAKATLAGAAAPPMRTVAIGTGEKRVEIGGETVLFRHEEKFHRPTAVAIKIKDDLPEEELEQKIEKINGLKFIRVGQEIGVNLIAVEHKASESKRYAEIVMKVKSRSKLPLILICPEVEALKAALEVCAAERPLLYAANANNYKDMAALAKQASCPLAVAADSLEQLATLTSELKGLGVEDLVLDPGSRDLLISLTNLNLIRRLALEKTFRPLGYPVITFTNGGDPFMEAAEAASYICKYGSIVVLEGMERWQILPLLTVRQNIYTDPQVPNAIEPKLYKVGEPGKESPVLVTTNFALTYFTVAGEVENSKVPAYIAVVNTEGLGVLNAYADDKLTAEKIVKTVKEYGVMEQVSHKKLIIPGLVAVLSGEVEEGGGWEVIVGPEEAAGIPSFLKNEWKPGVN